jgi:hypothetical protein
LRERDDIDAPCGRTVCKTPDLGWFEKTTAEPHGMAESLDGPFAPLATGNGECAQADRLAADRAQDFSSNFVGWTQWYNTVARVKQFSRRPPIPAEMEKSFI